MPNIDQLNREIEKNNKEIERLNKAKERKNMPSIYYANIDSNLAKINTKNAENNEKIANIKEKEEKIKATIGIQNAQNQTGDSTESSQDSKTGSLKESVLKESDDSNMQYGIPEEKKFPLDTKRHVLAAIRFFNYVPAQFEESLAKRIIKRMRDYDIGKDSVGDKNRLKKYVEASTILREFLDDESIKTYEPSLFEDDELKQEIVDLINTAIDSWQNKIGEDHEYNKLELLNAKVLTNDEAKRFIFVRVYLDDVYDKESFIYIPKDETLPMVVLLFIDKDQEAPTNDGMYPEYDILNKEWLA